MPSINANMHPPTTAADAIALGPARAARMPPVAAPDRMEFHGSSCGVLLLLLCWKLN